MQYKLTDLCNPKQWKTLATSELIDDGKYLVYGANGIIGKYDDYNHKEKTLMITCRGATCGNVHISEPYSYINGNAMCLDNLDTSKCDIKYLYFYLKNYDMKNVISGSAQPQITINSLNKVMIKILPLSEQKNIVKLFEKIENGILIKKNEILKFDEIIKSQFVEMFGDPFLNNKKWETIKIGECCSLKSGNSLPVDKENEGGKVLYVKVGDMNIQGNEKYITKSSHMVSENTAGKGVFDNGTVIFPKRGGAIGTNKKRLTKYPICADLNIMGVTPKNSINSDYL